MADTDDLGTRRSTLRGAMTRHPAAPRAAPPVGLTAEQVDELVRALDTSVGKLTSVVADQLGLSLNAVLLQERVTIPAEGFALRSFSAVVAFVAVWNDSANPVTFSESPPGSAARTSGIGVVVVRPGLAKGVPMTGSDLSMYATAGTTFDIAVYSRPLQPFAGPA